MANINKVSQSVRSQTPAFIEDEYPLFNKFIEYYYRSQEKTGLGQNILNNFLQYLDIDKLDIGILDGVTKIVEPIGPTDDTIVVESVDPFLENDGSILIGDEVIYYEKTTHAPNIALSPGVSYEQVKLKWTGLASPLTLFDGTTTKFALTSQNNPIAPPSAQHLIVQAYGEVLIPNIDYTVEGTDIIFTEAPRLKLDADGSSSTFITYLSGFVENNIIGIDNLSNSFGDSKRQFTMTRNSEVYEPVIDEYVLAVYDNKLLIPKIDFFIDGNQFIFKDTPLNGRFLSLYSVEAPIPSFGSGAIGYARIDDDGTLTGVSTSSNGSNYRFEYPPKVSINSDTGSGASATALVNGIKNVSLLDGGYGYSDTNPPLVTVQAPTKPGSTTATIKATVTDGAVSGLEITNSGSGYTFTPRLTFTQPGGATIAPPTMSNGSISGGITVTKGGIGYTTVPDIYVDPPTEENGIKASLRAVLTDGQVSSVEVLNAGQGYVGTPRVAIVDPTGAQILQTKVDGDGRVTDIELLSGGSGYQDVPSVYIVDERTDQIGNYAGGSDATAIATIFNGQIIDINITNFGSGYSPTEPPTIFIQSPSSAEASGTIGLNEVTGFTVNQNGSLYTKAKFEGCARAASGIKEYTEDGNAVFSSATDASSAVVNTSVKCLDALFIKRLLDKYTEQFLPDVPSLDYSQIDVRTAIKTIKDFYASKGTSYSIAYLFKLLYGETVSISYPKDQIIKPSAATWSIDTILRATLVSGDSRDIKDALLIQDRDIADSNVQDASALVENFISIKT
ncbi:MAG: baseplate wedge protein, partial [Alphaproteobacteria bacterium]|nr:baseplate wedge protein [Alphaproteobacteria bacterium]